MKIRHDRISIQ